MTLTRLHCKALTIVAILLAGVAAFACSGPPAGTRVEELAAAELSEPTAEPVGHEVVPAPATLSLNSGGVFILSNATEIRFSAGNEDVAWIAQYLAELVPLGASRPRPVSVIRQGVRRPNDIELVLDASMDSLGDEGYQLAVSRGGVTATARRPAGLFYAVQTLRQMLPPRIELREPLGNQGVAAVDITDKPRFAWRGAMLDVSRHFLRPADVKRYIDHMALYKLNRLHLHLADDQGWRIEIKSWPNLTTRGGSTAVGGGAGGFYTQVEYADIVEYASARFITVVPEIDMPGHTNAALASYPELNCDGRAPALYTGTRVGFSSLCVSKEVTYRFVDDVVREIGAITSGPWFHVGGDEVKTLSASEYAAFVERVQTIVRARGKEMIGWDEIGPTKLHPTTLVQYWRPGAKVSEAIRQGNRFILSPANKVYLDMKYDRATVLGLNWAGYINVRNAYNWDPARIIAGVAESSIVGVEAPLWSETLVTIADYEYMAFPRLAAVAEVAWSPQHRRDWTDFRRRVAAQAPRWSALGINYYRSDEISWP